LCTDPGAPVCQPGVIAAVTAGVWGICVAMVGWGPAGNAQVHTRSLGFWLPWIIVLALGLAAVHGIAWGKQRRATRT